MISDLINKIEQWAEDRNIIKGSKPIDQAMKLFSEFGELADNVGKGRDCRDDIGDVFVVLTIMRKQTGNSISNVKGYECTANAFDSAKEAIISLCYYLHEFSFNNASLIDSMACLNALEWIADSQGYTLEECVQIAYDDIKDRRGILVNGVFIKESDPAYADVLKSIEQNYGA